MNEDSVRAKPVQNVELSAELGARFGVALPIQKTSEVYKMDWDRIQGNWKQFTGRVKEKWGKLTDDDLTMVNGRRDQLEGRIQERYGYSKDQVRKEVAAWLRMTP
jgi:uncharacterized protein YjbJ (UPF0337 family)